MAQRVARFVERLPESKLDGFELRKPALPVSFRQRGDQPVFARDQKASFITTLRSGSDFEDDAGPLGAGVAFEV